MMKLYSFYTPSHERLVHEWFLPSIRGRYDVTVKKCEQIGPTENHVYRTREFNQTMAFKVELILEAIRENWNQVFLYSDVDVQFLGPTEEVILKRIQGRDLVFQRNTPTKWVCPGFFACVGSKTTLRLWEAVRRHMQRQLDQDDQDVLNDLLWKKHSRRIHLNRFARAGFMEHVSRVNGCAIRWDYLPNSFFCGASATGTTWKPGMQLRLPRRIVLHHANWTVGLKHKIAQLQYVGDLVSKMGSKNHGHHP